MMEPASRKTEHHYYTRIKSFKLSSLLLVCCYSAILWASGGTFTFFPRNIIPSSLGSQGGRLTSRQDTLASSASSAAPLPTGVLNVFQVSTPVLAPSALLGEEMLSNNTADVPTNASTPSTSNCQVTLMEFSFVDSFGEPFVDNYTPPSCIGTANTVIMNFTVRSQGVQFDRLALMYFGDSEVFRTSTAEPKRSGIAWEYSKDMSAYMYFWKSPQKMIFELDNQVTTNLTGVYNTTLTAWFFTAEENVQPADLIIPVSSRQGINASASSVFSIPSANATNTISFPRNANRAVFSLSSCGQANEEFWWSNVLQSDTATFTANDGNLFGFSPFREIQVYIDSQLAGVQWPFPVIFSGGVVPGLWSPIVGIDAFDLKEYEIDITPWLPLLCDGNQHTFSIKAAGLLDNGGASATICEIVGSSWFVSGNVFVWLDAAGSITTGSTPSVSAVVPTISVSQTLTKNSTGANETLTYTTSVQRGLTVSSTVKTQKGSQACSWTQTLSHTDLGAFLAFGKIQINNITTSGIDTSQGAVPFSYTYFYPLFANSTVATTPDGNVSISATVNRSKNIAIAGTSIYPSGLQVFASLPKSANLVSKFSGTTLSNSQNGAAVLFQSPSTNTSFSFGSTSQVYRFGGASAQGALGMEPDTELFFRNVTAANGTVMRDVQRVVGQQTVSLEANAPDGNSLPVQNSAQQILRPGPGLQKGSLFPG